jgi:hypothetical protein
MELAVETHIDQVGIRGEQTGGFEFDCYQQAAVSFNLANLNRLLVLLSGFYQEEFVVLYS